ncbi:hypothetical protein ACVXG7_25555 [Enterobacter hormaechei]
MLALPVVTGRLLKCQWRFCAGGKCSPSARVTMTGQGAPVAQRPFRHLDPGL